MIINGVPRQACAALIDQLKQPVILEPLTKFPVIRDLMVDRQIMFEHLLKVKAWVNIDGPWDLGRGPRMREQDRKLAYELSRCMTCGCCMEACPNVNNRADFRVRRPLAPVRLFNIHPWAGRIGRKGWRPSWAGGIVDCGNAQNCVEVCPKSIPLTTSIADLNRQTTIYSFPNGLINDERELWDKEFS